MIAFRDDARPGAGLYDEIVVDCFAGGGGASTGIEAALGRSVDVAVNHDPEAVALHRVNHPHSRHYCEDIYKVDPTEATGGRPVGLAWFSPDCKHFSKAKGGRPVSKRVRGLAWVVVRWAEKVSPRVIMLENVEEFTTWGPLVRDRPCPKRRGKTFRRWINTLRRLSYRVEYRELRACDFGAPTIRKRLFLIARRDDQPITWPEPTHNRDGTDGLRPWRTAAECIDWSIPCPSIFERKRPLKPATLRRIAAGIRRFVIDAAEPFILNVANSKTTGRGPNVWSIEDPLRTVTTVNGHALCVPTLIQTGYGERKGQRPRVPGLDRPLGTAVAGGQKHALVAAFLAQHNTGVVGHSLAKPASTITGKGCQQQLVAATIVKQNFGSKPCQAVDAPLHTVTTQGNRFGVVAAHLSTLRGTSKHGRAAGAPAPTLTAGGTHVAAVAAFLTSYYGNEQDGSDSRDPLRVITTKDRHAIVTVDVQGQTFAIADIGMRMLTPRELYRCQGFPDSYVIDRDCEGRPLTKTAQVRMVGNSVCPPMAESLVRANCVSDRVGVAA